ncbi:MAG: hypothetical protein QNJ53_07230 [Pleurocapsa sp. MO_192.B19]|nr:hypothetical protein [Pleurocapsa sp. MO_192.B19]
MANTVLDSFPTTPQWCSLQSDLSIEIATELHLTDTWVKLLELPNPYSHDEALILCKHSESERVAWVPDHGEAIINNSQFCMYS